MLVDRRGELVAIGEALVDSSELAGHRHGWVVDAKRVLVDPARYPPLWGSHKAPAAPAPPAADAPTG